MLHDGLGSVAQWRSVPEMINARTGAMVMVYNRPGHGTARPIPSGPWPVSWMHDEARRLVALLEASRVDKPLLVGHSDGGSIALLAAAAGLPVSGVVALAPHSFVEPVCAEAISAMRANRQPIVDGLASFHSDSSALFEAWSSVWVSAEFASWDIRDELASVDSPCVVVQGDSDEYATDMQLAETTTAINVGSMPGSEVAEAQLWPGVGHLVHHEAPDAVVDLVASMFNQHA